MDDELLVDPEALREQVRGKYREVAVDPGASFHFHTGRPLAAGWDTKPARSTRCPTGPWSLLPGWRTRSHCTR